MKKESTISLEEFEAQRLEFFKKRDELRYPGMKFTEDELKANEIFKQKLSKEKLPEDFYTHTYKYFDFM